MTPSKPWSHISEVSVLPWPVLLSYKSSAQFQGSWKRSYTETPDTHKCTKLRKWRCLFSGPVKPVSTSSNFDNSAASWVADVASLQCVCVWGGFSVFVKWPGHSKPLITVHSPAFRATRRRAQTPTSPTSFDFFQRFQTAALFLPSFNASHVGAVKTEKQVTAPFLHRTPWRCESVTQHQTAGEPTRTQQVINYAPGGGGIISVNREHKLWGGRLRRESFTSHSLDTFGRQTLKSIIVGEGEGGGEVVGCLAAAGGGWGWSCRGLTLNCVFGFVF